MVQKHAYLIMAHGDFALLQCLARALDDPRNDLFIHIDAKVSNLPEVRTEKAGAYMLKDRIDVRWGDVSQIETELLLFKTAVDERLVEFESHLLRQTALMHAEERTYGDYGTA